MKRFRLRVLASLALMMSATQVAFTQSAKDASKEGTKAQVKLVAAVDAVAPSKPFDVALHFKIARGWHIYWQNSGESGQPPRVEWSLPAGFLAGDLQFPIPVRHRDPSGFITTNILEGEPAILVAVTPPASIDSSEVRIAGKVRYLVCAEICLQEQADVVLTLPVLKSGGTAKAANESIFERAQDGAAADFEPVRQRTSGDKACRTQARGQVRAAGARERGRWAAHASSAEASPGMTATDLFVERVADVYFDPVEYPLPTATDAKSGWYSGSIVARVPGEIDGTAKPPFRFGGVLKYQPCDEKGECQPVEALAFRVGPEKHGGATSGDNQGTGMAGVLSAPKQAAPPPSKSNVTVGNQSPENGNPKHSFLWILGLAFLGGLLLNVMPCVLPVISIKVLSLVQEARESPGRIVRLGMTFCLGMMVSFWALALIIIMLKSAGDQLGWGFQFQSPRFVLVMITIMFAFGLSLLGVFEVTLPGATVTKLSAAEEHEGYLGAFMKGVLSTILATPCTAPYLGHALGVAFLSTSAELFVIFTAVGLGMSLPFVVLSAEPKWVRHLPRPGPWMEHFKHLMGFLLMGTVVWLMFTLGAHIGVGGLAWTGAYLVFLGLSCWILGLQSPLTPLPRRLMAWTAAVVLVLGGWWFSFERDFGLAHMSEQVRVAKFCPCEDEIPALLVRDWDKKIPWQPWSKGRPEFLASNGYTVYVDYTATWCATCQANKAATLESQTVRELMRDQCIIPLTADFTSEDPDILSDLHKFGRSGVPLNVIYPAGKPDEPIVMPEQLVGRVSLVLDKLAEAGPTTDCARATSRTSEDGASDAGVNAVRTVARIGTP